MATRFTIIEGGKLSVVKSADKRSPFAQWRLFHNWHSVLRRDGKYIFTLITAPVALFSVVWSWTGSPAFTDKPAQLFAADTENGSFSFCHIGGGYNCVVDGDTLYYHGIKIRVADIDTPETHPPRCTEEARLGEAATRRLLDWVNAGPFQLQSIDRDEDRYGRKLRIITRKGTTVGNELVSAGLARWYEGGRKSWC